MLVHSIDLDVIGWGPAHSSAHAVVIHYTFWGRLARALEAVAVVWVVALLLMIVPTLIIPAVGIGVALSVFLFVVRLRAPEVARVCRGTCPDCGYAQAFDVPVRFELPVEVECQKCSRGLTLEEHHTVA